jgi:hypothetical protein
MGLIGGWGVGVRVIKGMIKGMIKAVTKPSLACDKA